MTVLLRLRKTKIRDQADLIEFSNYWQHPPTWQRTLGQFDCYGGFRQLPQAAELNR